MIILYYIISMISTLMDTGDKFKNGIHPTKIFNALDHCIFKFGIVYKIGRIPKKKCKLHEH
jgi:hypothetical protein